MQKIYKIIYQLKSKYKSNIVFDTRLLKKNDIPYGIVNSLSSLKHDPHLKDVKFFRKIIHPTEGKIVVPDTSTSNPFT